MNTDTDENNNWTDIRGKKINSINKPRHIDFSLISKRIQILVNKELVNATWKNNIINLPNKYASWLVK